LTIKKLCMKKWRKWVIVVGILSLLSTIFTGCKDKEVYAFESEIIPVAFPEGVSLKHLYITHQGMRGGSYYMLKSTDAGVYMKISNLSPDDWRMLEGEEVAEEQTEYLAFADTVKECEYASLVLLDDDTVVEKLEEAIAKTGALDWDGYKKSLEMKGVEDSGDSYKLYLELTDKTTVTVDSYNASPAGFRELLYQIEEIFYENRDYSRYFIKDFEESPCTAFYVCFRKAFGKGEWRLELRSTDNQWTVVLTDPDGQFLDAGTGIAEYQRSKQELPFERFLEIFKKHGAESWNGYEASGKDTEDYFYIRLSFQNGKEFKMSGSLLPEGFEEFQKEFIEEIYHFYNEYKA